MDHRPLRGLAALAIFTVSPALAGLEDPPASGLGSATVSAPVAETTTPAGPELDPDALADRLLASLEAEVPATTPDVADEAEATEASPVIEAASPTATVVDGSPIPATTPAASIIDRFRPESRPPAGGDGSTTTAGSTGFLQSPELRVGLLLVGFVGLAVIARKWSNARGPRAGRPSGVVSVLARYPFGRGGALVLLEVGPRLVLVHQESGRGGDVRTVTEFTSPEEVAEMRARLGIAQRAAEPGFGADLERNLGLYDRNGRPRGFGGPDGLPLDDAMETVDLTRRRPRRGSRIS